MAIRHQLPHWQALSSQSAALLSQPADVSPPVTAREWLAWQRLNLRHTAAHPPHHMDDWARVIGGEIERWREWVRQKVPVLEKKRKNNEQKKKNGRIWTHS